MENLLDHRANLILTPYEWSLTTQSEQFVSFFHWDGGGWPLLGWPLYNAYVSSMLQSPHNFLEAYKSHPGEIKYNFKLNHWVALHFHSSSKIPRDPGMSMWQTGHVLACLSHSLQSWTESFLAEKYVLRGKSHTSSIDTMYALMRTMCISNPVAPN